MNEFEQMCDVVLNEDADEAPRSVEIALLEYLDGLPSDRQAALSRAVHHLAGLEEEVLIQALEETDVAWVLDAEFLRGLARIVDLARI